MGALFLHVVVVDEREVDSSSRGNEALTESGSARSGTRRDNQSLLTSAATRLGTSLPALIADTRSQLSSDLIALAAFNDRLLDRCWLDAYASRYEGRRWTVRREHTFRVAHGFPRLMEADLPSGVGDVNYAVSLAVCAPFATPVAVILATLSESNSHRKRKSRRKQ